LASVVEARWDLEAVLAAAGRAPPVSAADPFTAITPAGAARVAVAGGPAFSFVYPDNLELLSAAGAELVEFDPLVADRLPENVTGLYAGGGFPEVFAPALSGNEPLLADVRARIAEGLVTWAECGGLLWLAESLDGHRMAGVIPAQGRMTDRLTLGYRTATVRTDSPVAPRGTVLRGHEFHYSTLAPAGSALELAGRFGSGCGGWASPTLLASYLHVHLAAHPEVATRWVAAAASSAVASSAGHGSPV
jgi:cobyrinic acid a,c-diamide synthase